MSKKILSLFLAILCLASVLVSCADNGANEGTTPITEAGVESGNAAATEAVTEAETVPANLADNLPESKNFNDEFVILSRKSTMYELESQETTGDIVADGVTARNQAVEERFGVTITVVGTPGEWGDRDAYIALVKSSVASGKSDYDLMSTHSAYIVNLGLAGLSYNMNELSQIDFSKKWWSEFYAENVEINGMVFSAVGDIDYTLYEFMMALFVNKKIAGDYGVTDLYDTVKDGSWTFERMMQNVKKVSYDANGNQTADQGDIFGFGLGGHTGRMCATVWDTQMTVKNAEGVQTLNLPNEKYLDVYNTIYHAVYDNTQNVLFINDNSKIINEFAEQRLLYLSEAIGSTKKFKNMTDEYAIIPFPKYNADQKTYISSSRDYMSAIAVPSSIDNPEMVGTVVEAMCMYGYKKITPEYYDVTLKFKYVSDADGVEMLDIIRDNVRHDFAMTFTNSLNLMYSIMGDNLRNGAADLTSTLSGNVKSWKKQISAIYDTYASLKK